MQGIFLAIFFDIITYNEAISRLQKPHSMKQLYIGNQELCDLLKITNMIEFVE